MLKIEGFDLKETLKTTEEDDIEEDVINEFLPKNETIAIHSKDNHSQKLTLSLALGKDYKNFKIKGKKRVLYVNTKYSDKQTRSFFRKEVEEMKVGNEDYFVQCCIARHSPEIRCLDEFVKIIIDKYEDQNIDVLFIDEVDYFICEKSIDYILESIDEINEKLNCSTILIYNGKRNYETIKKFGGKNFIEFVGGEFHAI